MILFVLFYMTFRSPPTLSHTSPNKQKNKTDDGNPEKKIFFFCINNKTTNQQQTTFAISFSRRKNLLLQVKIN